MNPRDRRRRSRHVLFWRIFNPFARSIAGIAPWWVLLQTTGHRSGKQRRTPLARGPTEDNAIWLIAVHGHHATWVKNLETTAAVRIRIKGRWHEGLAQVHVYDPRVVDRFRRYARTGPRLYGIDPALVRIELSS